MDIIATSKGNLIFLIPLRAPYIKVADDSSIRNIMNIGITLDVLLTRSGFINYIIFLPLKIIKRTWNTKMITPNKKAKFEYFLAK